MYKAWKDKYRLRFQNPLPAPVILRACHESRQVALEKYQLQLNGWGSPSKVYIDFARDFIFLTGDSFSHIMGDKIPTDYLAAMVHVLPCHQIQNLCIDFFLFNLVLQHDFKVIDPKFFAQIAHLKELIIVVDPDEFEEQGGVELTELDSKTGDGLTSYLVEQLEGLSGYNHEVSFHSNVERHCRLDSWYKKEARCPPIRIKGIKPIFVPQIKRSVTSLEQGKKEI